MRIFPALLLFPLLVASASVTHAQAGAPTASSILSPALDHLRQSLADLRLDKWKAPGPVRQEANSNIGSVTRDLDGTLPALLVTADAAPGVISQNLPVFRNIDALYDVLLRVVETADLSAPEDETERLHGALSSLDEARRSLGDAIESAAIAQEKQVAALQEQLHAQPAAPAASSTPVDTSKPAASRRRKPVARPPQ